MTNKINRFDNINGKGIKHSETTKNRTKTLQRVKEMWSQRVQQIGKINMFHGELKFCQLRLPLLLGLDVLEI